MQILYSAPDDFHIWIHCRQGFVVYCFCWHFFMVSFSGNDFWHKVHWNFIWENSLRPILNMIFSREDFYFLLPLISEDCQTGNTLKQISAWGFLGYTNVLNSANSFKVCGSKEVILFHRKYCNSMGGFEVTHYQEIFFSTLWPELRERRVEYNLESSRSRKAVVLTEICKILPPSTLNFEWNERLLKSMRAGIAWQVFNF